MSHLSGYVSMLTCADVSWRMLYSEEEVFMSHLSRQNFEKKKQRKKKRNEKLTCLAKISLLKALSLSWRPQYVSICTFVLVTLSCLLTYADVCWRMLAYADVCWRMLTYLKWTLHSVTFSCLLTYSSSSGVSICTFVLARQVNWNFVAERSELVLKWTMQCHPLLSFLAYADVCRRMRTYADVCGRMHSVTLSCLSWRMQTYADVCRRMRTYA